MALVGSDFSESSELPEVVTGSVEYSRLPVCVMFPLAVTVSMELFCTAAPELGPVMVADPST